jgi:hypothetical protein
MTGQTVGRLGTRYLGLRGELGEASEGGARLGIQRQAGQLQLRGMEVAEHRAF